MSKLQIIFLITETVLFLITLLFGYVRIADDENRD